MALRDKVISLLEKTVDDLKANNSELSESEAMDVMRILCHQEMSKAQACNYLNMSRSKFDSYVRMKLFPRGRKVVGHNELRWYRDELDECSRKIKDQRYVRDSKEIRR